MNDAHGCWTFAVALSAIVAFSCNTQRLDLFDKPASVVAGDPIADDEDVVEPSASPSVPVIVPDPEPLPSPMATPRMDAGSGSEPLPSAPPPASTPGPRPIIDAGPVEPEVAPMDAGPSEPEVQPVDATAPRPDFILIDDFEDNDVRVVGRGWWYVTTDFTAGQQNLDTVIVATRPGFVLRAAASGFTDWGAIVGVDLRGEEGFFDATPTNALRFYAQVSSERAVLVRILLQDGTAFATEVTLTTEWAEFVLPFDSFEGTTGVPVDPSTISHLQLFFGLEAFEVRLDDFAFITL